MKLLALGPKGTYGHEAALEVLKRLDDGRINLCGNARPHIELCSSHASVFESLVHGDLDYAIVPIENSIESYVADTLRGFWLTPAAAKSGVLILAEISLPIRHELLVRPGVTVKDIMHVLSHPQALGQCRKTLQRLHLTDHVPTKSTAEAARIVSSQKGYEYAAALASRFAADSYGLETLIHNAADMPHNITRFHLLGYDTLRASDGFRTAVIFKTRNRPAALWKALAPIAREYVNMGSIHSLPLGNPGEFAFYVEFDEHIGTEKGKRIWAGLKIETESVQWLGSFPQEQGESK